MPTIITQKNQVLLLFQASNSCKALIKATLKVNKRKRKIYLPFYFVLIEIIAQQIFYKMMTKS